jgi:hypothetical protein
MNKLQKLLDTYNKIFPRENLSKIKKKDLMSDISWFRGLLEGTISRENNENGKI